MKKILLGYDGSRVSEQALLFALDLATRYAAELHVLAVAHCREPCQSMDTHVDVQTSLDYFRQTLEPLYARTEAACVKSHVAIAVGRPAEQLVRYAERNGIDHIVVGHRSEALLERSLMGSVARQVAACAHCAVTVVRK